MCRHLYPERTYAKLSEKNVVSKNHQEEEERFWVLAPRTITIYIICKHISGDIPQSLLIMTSHI